MAAPIYLFTDFRYDGPYVGQMHGAILNANPSAHVVDLMHDAPCRDPKRSAYLLAAVVRDLPPDATIVCVVDPGVGGTRDPLLVEAGDRKLVGPDNGLMEIVMRHAPRSAKYVLEWRPEILSASFHGRDLFAPAAALWSAGHQPASVPAIPFADSRPGADWPDDLAQVIYIDGFGNAMTGLRAATLPDPARVALPDGTVPTRARTFSDVPRNFGFWYENSLGLVEIAVNGDSAARKYDLSVGSPVELG